VLKGFIAGSVTCWLFYDSDSNPAPVAPHFWYRPAKQAVENRKGL